MEPWDSRVIAVRLTVDHRGMQTLTLFDDVSVTGGRLESLWASSGGFSVETLDEARADIWACVTAMLRGNGQASLL